MKLFCFPVHLPQKVITHEKTASFRQRFEGAAKIPSQETTSEGL
jgi:hypothetical protein